MSQYFILRLKKTGQILFFVFVCGLLLNSTGCGLWRKPWKIPGRGIGSHQKYGKELPEAPLHPGRSQNELIDQAAVLRNTAPQSIQDSDFEPKEEKAPWYKRSFLMSSKASEIDNHLGK
ncbi:MAG: hypothetical protein FWC43_14290 [Planctomycetaceae bacterium]|nr:hypothetical protein [Planctomycetaceae bacterium]